MEPQDRTVVQLLAALQVDVPFGAINGHQMQCDVCAKKRLADQASESQRPGAR